MADSLDTTLRFLGDPAQAQAAINGLIASLQNAAATSAKLFAPVANQSNQAAAALNGASAATDKLAASAARAEAAMFRQAQIQARIQQISGDSTGAIKTLGDALAKATDPKSLPALRAELQKTYLDTNYTNSPLIGAIRSISGGFGSLRPILGSTAGDLQKIAGVAGSAAEGLGGIGASGAGVAVALGAVTAGVAALAVAVVGLVAVASAAASALFSIGKAGIETNAKFESLKLGIATVIASVAEIRNSDGVQLKGIDALNASLPVAAEQMRKLKIDALSTSATIADIGPAFQAAIGPGLTAGLTIDQIRENTIKLTQAVTALGLPMDQIKQETRAILSGDINRNTQAALALGITREAALEAQKQGKFAEFLEQKLQGAAAAGALVAKTFEAARSNIKEAADSFGAVVTEGLFNQLRDKLNAVLPQIFDTGKANLISDNFKGIADTLTRVFDTAGASINRVIDFAIEGIKSISVFLSQNQATIGEIIEEVNQVISLVAETVAGVFRIVAGAQDAGSEMNALAALGKAVVVVVGLIGDGIKFWASSLFLVGNAIKLVIIAPLEVAVKLLAALLSGIPFAGAAADNAARALEASRKSATAGIVESSKNLASSIANVGQASAKSIAQIDEARKRAAAGQRAVSGLAAPTPGATGATFTGPKRAADDGKGAASAARAAAAAELKELQQLEKEKELLIAREQARLKSAFDDRLISETDFVERSIELDRELLLLKLKTLDAEEAAAIRSVKTKEQVEAKKAEFSFKRAQAEQDIELRTEEKRDQLRRKIEKAEEDHQKALLDLRAAADRQEVARVRDLESQKIVGAVAAERRVAEIEAAAFARRRAALDAETAKIAPGDTIGAQKLADDIAKLEAERAAAVEEASRRIRQAREKEIASEKSFRDAIQKGENDLTASQIEAEKRRIDLLSTNAVGTGARSSVIDLRAANDRAAENLRHDQAQQSLLNQENELQGQASTFEQALEVERQFNSRFEEERKRHNLALQGISTDQAAQQSANDPTSKTTLFGADFGAIFEQTGSLLKAFEGTALSSFEKMSGAAGNFGTIAAGAMSSLGKGVGSLVSNFVLLGTTGPAALRKMTASVLAEVASQAAVKAIFELAAGFAALFWNPAEASAHFTSAALFGSVAGVAAGVGRAVAGNSFAQGGGQSAGAGAFGGQQQGPQDSRFTRGNVAGRVGPEEPQVSLFEKLLFSKIGAPLEVLNGHLVTHSQAIDRLAANVDDHGKTISSFETRISSIAPEDVLSVAAERRPDLIGEANNEHLSRNPTALRGQARLLGLS